MSRHHTMRIRSIAKQAPACSERTVPVEVTLARASLCAAALGITRLANITGLDRLGIPVYSAVVPKSDDSISVYNGKGVQFADAKAGALMEAVERQTALRASFPVVEGSLRALRRGKRAIADPRTFNQTLHPGYGEDCSCIWTDAYDLIGREPVLVPAGLVGYGPRYGADRSPFPLTSSNGLASGNCFEEAVCHALCELIERDAYTLAELRSRWIPRARLEAALGADAGSQAWDDPDAYPRIDLNGAGDPFPQLLARFEQAGLRPVVRDITSDLGVPSAVASVADDSVLGFPQAHGGFGAHPNARIAVARAIAELAQSRAVDIQGAREDLVAAGGNGRPLHRHTQRVSRIDLRRWILQANGAPRPFAAMPSFQHDDIAGDIRLILSTLERHGMQRVLVVNLPAPENFSVVRVMVPGLEYWAMDRGNLGTRALNFWKRHAG